MDKILPYILATFKQKKRYKPEIKWSDTSVVYNLFRIYELIFWREFGIRIESTSYFYQDENKNVFVTRIFYTWESMICHAEGTFRNYLKRVVRNFRIPTFNIFQDFVPQFAFQGFYTIPATENKPKGYVFAIAADAGSDSGNIGSSTTGSVAHTITGSNPLLFTGVHTAAQNNTVTSVKWNTTETSTQVGGINGNTRRTEGWYLKAPTTGTFNIDVVAAATLTAWSFGGSSYSGVEQSNPLNGSATANMSGTTITLSITTTVDNSWLIGCAASGNAGIAAGANTTLRKQVTGLDSFYLIDSNAAKTPTGGYSLVVTDSGGAGNDGGIGAGFAPAVATTAIKTVGGLAYASVKTVGGLAVASVKNISGLA